MLQVASHDRYQTVALPHVQTQLEVPNVNFFAIWLNLDNRWIRSNSCKHVFIYSEYSRRMLCKFSLIRQNICPYHQNSCTYVQNICQIINLTSRCFQTVLNTWQFGWIPNSNQIFSISRHTMCSLLLAFFINLTFAFKINSPEQCRRLCRRSGSNPSSAAVWCVSAHRICVSNSSFDYFNVIFV